MRDHDLHRSRTPMKRAVVALTLLFGSTIPLVMAAVFLFGCCVLPFHHVLHRVMPLCHIATGILNVHHDDSDHHPSPPPTAKQKQGGSLLTILRVNESPARLMQFAVIHHGAQSRIAFRSFISLGAARCDPDVGLLAILIETFRI